MSGEGAAVSGIGSFAEIIDRMMSGRPLRGPVPETDVCVAYVHPDQLNKWRPIGEVLDLAEALDPLAVVGARRDGEGWSVLLMQRGSTLSRLTAEQARELSHHLADMADVIEGKRW